MRRQVRYIATVLLALLLQPAVVHAQNEQGDVTLQVTPVQSVLPPQAGRYIDNLGRYFSVTVINKTDVQQNLYFGVQIKQLFPDDVLWMSTDVETMHIPQRPIVLAPNQHKTLNTIELKHLFDHFDSKDIYVRDGRYRNILDSEFGLLDEGQYELYLTAYEWATDLTTPVVKNNQTDGIARFNICYEAEPPRFTLPVREATTEGLSDLSVTKIDKNQASIRFEWMAPTLNCNATMVQFRYNIRFVELGSMMPDEAMQENTITFLEKRELLTNSFTIPQAYLSQMIADTAFLGKVYAMQVTAYTPYQNENSLNVALIKNEGKSDIFLFQLYDPTKKPESAISGKGLGTDDQAGPIYIFEQPTLTSPQFPEDASRLIYMGDSIKVEWRKAWHVGGKGERQDTIDFKYNVALYTGNSADSRDAILKTSKPLYEKTTEELTDTIRWDEIADKVHQGDYLLLRVTAKPTCTPDSIVEMKSDSVNITDFALTRHFDEEYQCGHENIQVANKTTLGEVPDKNQSIKIGRFYLTLDGPEPVTYDKENETYKGKGWIRWSPKADNYFNMNSRVAVKFDNLKINTDYEVYEGRCVTYPYSDGKTEYTDAQAVDSLFSLASLDEIYGSLDLPDEVRSLVSKGVNEWGDDVEEATKSLAKSYNLGKYYSTYKLLGAKWEDMQHGDAFDLYFPMEVPEEISKFLPKSFSVQIGSMQFTPQSAQMNVIGEIALPNSDVFDGQNVLIFGAPRLCITPDKFWPEEGVLALLSNLPLKDPNTDFKMTFKAPTEPLDPRPGDGCFLRWDADGFAGLGMHIAMTMPNTKRVVDGQAKDIPALLDLKATIEGGDDAMDFIATGSLTPFEAVDLPGWTFHIGEDIIFDYNMSRNDRLMPTIDEFKKSYAQMSYDEEKKKFVAKSDDTTFDATLCGAYVNDGNWDAWQGVYIRNLEVEFPKFAVFGNGKQGTKIGASNMLIDASGITCRVFSENVLDAQTGKCGGWKFTLDKAYVDIIQNNFDNCTITGGFGVPLLGKVAQDKAADEAAKKDGGKSGSSTEKKDDQQETDIEYYCQIRHMTKPGYKEYQVWNKAGTEKVTKKRKEYDDNRLSYVFTTKNADKAPLAMNFFVADMTLLPDQTYFLVESVDPEKEGGKQYTQVELCMAGDITIAGLDGKHTKATNAFTKRVEALNAALPMQLKLPGIHFAKMRLSNVKLDDWNEDLGIDEYRTHQTGIDAQEKWEADHKKLYEFTEGKELKLGTDCYFNYGEWSLASAQKKVGPFTFGLKKFTPSMQGDNISLDVEGMLGLMDGKFDVSAGISISAALHKGESISDWYLSDGTVDFKSIELNVDWEVFKFYGRLELDKSQTDKGYSGNIGLEIKDLFSLKVAGGYFNHKGISTDEKNKKIADAKQRAKKEDGNEKYYTKYYDPSEDFFSWGYFLITVGGQGLRIDPVVINRITGGFYYNTQPVMGKKDSKGHPVYDAKPTAKYGTIGVVFGIGITTSGGENTVQGDLDVVVIYDKKNNRMTHFEFNGEIEAVGGIIHSKASLIYENNDDDRYLCLNLTVTSGLDSDALVSKLTGISNELKAVQEELGQFQSNITGDLMKKPSTSEMMGSLKEVESDYSNKTSESDKTKNENKVSDGAKKSKVTAGKTDVYLELKFTYREKGSNKYPTKWHLYLGEPQKNKRCTFTYLDYKDKLGILTVNIGADAYLCIGNELPGNGQLPEIPSEITEFLNGHKNSAVSTGADMGKVNNARSEVMKKMLSTAGAGGGVMLGASAWGFINVDLGLFYGYMKALAGFDLSLVKYSTPQYCANYGGNMGKDGWYAMGQLYAYLAAKFGLHIKLGKLIDERIDLVDAGIGGVFKMGLPKPTWFEGQARVKVTLLGGLVKIDKGFNFSGGTKCVPFKGNALDDFNLFGDVTVASDSIQEGWDVKNAISINEAKNMMFTTYANLGERYRLYDPTTGGDLSEEKGYSEAEMNLYASRTYIFDINKDRVYTENSKANINDCLGAVLYEINPDTVFNYIKLMPMYYGQSNVKPTSEEYFQNAFFRKALWNNRIMSRWMKSEKLDSEQKPIEKYLVDNDNAMRAVKQWEGGYEAQGSGNYYYSYPSVLSKCKVPGGVTIRETTGRTFHLSMPKLKPGKLYILELNAQAFEVLNGKRVWTKMTVETGYTGERKMHDEYVRWEQKKLVFFRTKANEETVIPEHLKDIQPYVALAYPSVGKNQLFQKRDDIEENKANIIDIQEPIIALNEDIRSSFASGTLNWKLSGNYKWTFPGTNVSQQNSIKTQTISNEFKTTGGCLIMHPSKMFDLSSCSGTNLSDAQFNLRLEHTYQVYDRTIKVAKDPSIEYENIQADFIAQKGEYAFYTALYDFITQELGGTWPNDRAHTSNDDITQVYVITIAIVAIFGDYEAFQNKFQSFMYARCNIPMVEKKLYKDTTVVLANMWLKCVPEASWKAGPNPLRDYEKQFVGVKPYLNPSFTHSGNMGSWNWDNDKDIAFNEKKSDGKLLRLSDPWLYFSYLSKWVFINDVALKQYDFDDVNVPHASESLTYSFNGHGISGSMIPGANFRDKSLLSLRWDMYNAWLSDWSSLTYPLPLNADDDWGLTGNNQIFPAQPYNKFYRNPSNNITNPESYSDIENNSYLGAKYLLQQFAAPYFIAQTLCTQMSKIATQVENIYEKGTKNGLSGKQINAKMIDWQNLHRGQYLKVSSMGHEVQVPYYQFPLIYGGTWSSGGRSFGKSIGSGLDDKISKERKSQAASCLFFERLKGGTASSYDKNYKGAYPGVLGVVPQDIFSALNALDNVKQFSYWAYRVNGYDMTNNVYKVVYDVYQGVTGNHYANFQSGLTGYVVNKGSNVVSTKGKFDNMYYAIIQSAIGIPEVYINGVPSSVAFTEDTSDAGKRQNAAQLEKLASWLQDNDPDLYACYKETNNTKKIKMLQQWAASNDPDLIYWADISKDLWWVMLWNEVNASYWKAQNQVLKSMGMPAAYPEKEPTFSNTLFKEIVSHKYGIIW